MTATDTDQSIAEFESHHLAAGTSNSLCGTPAAEGGNRHTTAVVGGVSATRPSGGSDYCHDDR
jgi:hypothetical protein